MVNQQTFGRRKGAQPPQAQPSRAWPKTEPTQEPTMPVTAALAYDVPTEQVPRADHASALSATRDDALSIDRELEEWKRARGGLSRLPWRQLWLMASLSFGITSLVLPDSVNENVDYLLWGLMAASAIAGFTRRRKNKSTATQHAVGIARDLTGL